MPACSAPLGFAHGRGRRNGLSSTAGLVPRPAMLPPLLAKLTLPALLLGRGRAPDFGSFIWVR